MTPDEMRAKGIVDWSRAAEICERLDAILVELKRTPKADEGWIPASELESLVTNRNDWRERAEKAEARLAMHPDGCCGCADEGTCQWCRMITAEACVQELEKELAEVRRHLLDTLTQRNRARDFARSWRELCNRSVDCITESIFLVEIKTERDLLATEEDAGK